MSYLNQLLAKGINVLKGVSKNWVYNVNFGGAKIKRMGGLGFLKREHSKEEIFLASIDLKGCNVFDIGGYIGLMTVYFSKKVGSKGRVVVFEPNKSNIERINTHISLNNISNAQIIEIGIADSKKELSFVVRKGSEATGSLDEGIQSLLKQEGKCEEFTIQVDSLDHITASTSLPAPHFIKIDIEGMEYPALQGMINTITKFSPRFFIEIHGSNESFKKENISNIFNFFKFRNYSIYHVESSQFLSANNIEIAKQGHIYCEPKK